MTELRHQNPNVTYQEYGDNEDHQGTPCQIPPPPAGVPKSPHVVSYHTEGEQFNSQTQNGGYIIT